MSTQVKRRREAATFLSTYTGAQGELLVDTTNNRVQVHDGVTPGGWPAAKLSEVVLFSRTAVADAAYTVLASDRTIAFTALTAARIVSLPASSAYPTGYALTIFDESGSASATRTITVVAAGTDKIDGASSAVISSAYGYLALQNNGAGKWSIVDQAMSNLGPVGIGTAADPNNPLSVYGASALFNSPASFSFTINKAAPANTASIIFEDNFSARAQIGLCGDDNFRFKVSANGTTFYDALDIASATGQVTATFGIVSSTIDNCVIGGTTPAAASVTSLNGGPLAGLRSRLRNANFAINQRAVSGTVTLAAGAYGHDGVKAGAAGATYTFATAGIDTVLTITAGSLILPIEAGLIEGGVYSVSQAGTAQARVWQGTGSSGSGAYATMPFQTPSLTAATQTNVEFSTGTLALAQFELGLVATAFERRPPAVELVLCQRLFQRWQQPPLRGYYGGGASVYRLGMVLPVAMRATPTVTMNGNLPIAGAINTTVTAVVASYCKPNACEIDGNLASTSGLTVGQPLVVYQSSGVASLDLAAEI